MTNDKPLRGHRGRAGNGLGLGRGDVAVLDAASITVISHDLAGGVNPLGGGKGRAGRVDRGVAAPAQQVAMSYAASVVVLSDDIAGVVDPIGSATGRVGHVDRGVAVHAPVVQEAEKNDTNKVHSHDQAGVVDS